MREIAHTTPGVLPPFINISSDGELVTISIRSKPREFDGVAVCKVDCKPGDGVCNNYCGNLIGVKARRAPAKTHLRQGAQASIELSATVFEELVRMWLASNQEQNR